MAKLCVTCGHGKSWHIRVLGVAGKVCTRADCLCVEYIAPEEKPKPMPKPTLYKCSVSYSRRIPQLADQVDEMMFARVPAMSELVVNDVTGQSLEVYHVALVANPKPGEIVAYIRLQ